MSLQTLKLAAILAAVMGPTTGVIPDWSVRGGAKRPRKAQSRPTLEQRTEIEVWNDAVEARKAEKRARRK